MRHATPLEFKDAGGDDRDDVKDALADLTKSTTDALTKITEDVKKITVRQDEIERKANRSRLGGSDPGETKGDRAAEHKAIGAFAKAGDDSEFKAMSVGNDPAGGYFVMPAVSVTMTKRIFDQSPIRRLARVVTIETGDGWEEPLDKGESGATWVGETQTRPETDTPEVGLLNVPLREIWAQQPITQKLLDTSYINIGAWIEEKLSDKFARTEGVEFVLGSHPLKPQGFMTLEKSALGDFGGRPNNALQFVLSSSATAITADSLRTLFWALRAGHRGNATWLMSSGTASELDKLKDGNGDYLWRDSSAAGVPPTLLGRPVEFDENMPAVAAGSYPIAFGDWKAGYVIIDRLGLRFVRDPFTRKPHVLFDAFKRVGGAVANTDAIKLLQIAA